jgi:hypothetical protein
MSTLAVEMEASPRPLYVVAELPVWSTPAKFNVILNDQRRQRKNWTFDVLLLDHRSQGGRARDALTGWPSRQPASCRRDLS